MINPTDPTAVATSRSAPVRVMVVDDSAVVRGLMTRALREDPGIEIVASAANGLMALHSLQHQPVDVVILDIEMPEMDGMTALPKIFEMAPQTKVIMASSLTLRNAEISLRALEMGASDYVPKPSSRNDPEEVQNFYRELISKVKAIATSKHQKETIVPAAPVAMRISPSPVKPVTPPTTSTTTSRSIKYPLQKPTALAIGSSTGGPQALLKLFEALRGQLTSIPIFITQHMPPTFTTILAEHIGQMSGKPCHEAKQGEKALANHIYMAPGDYHMLVEKRDPDVIIRLTQDPPVNYCRPAVDPMLKSLTTIYGSGLLVAILTGMGHDGLVGSKEAVHAGATVIAQDEATSVVWGMPRAVAEEKICSAVLPLQEIPSYLIKSFGG